MSNGDDRGLFTIFAQFIDPGAANLTDKVDFRGLIGLIFNNFVLLLFLAVVGLVQSVEEAWSIVVQSFSDMIRLIVTAPTLTLAEIQQQAVGIASREIADFGLIALPVGIVAALAAVGVVVFVVNVFWRP